MKTILLLGFFCLFLRGIQAQTIELKGTINSNLTLVAETIKVTGEVSIPNGITLTIAAGSNVEFYGYYNINVWGTLVAEGNQQDSIRFFIKDTTGFSNRNTLTGAWGGIHFDHTSPVPSNQISKLNYCSIRYCKTSTNGAALSLKNVKNLILSHCRISNNSTSNFGGGLYAYQTSIPIEQNIFSDNYAKGAGGGIYLLSCLDFTMNQNLIYNNQTEGKGAGIYSSFSTYSLNNNVIVQNKIQKAGNYGGGIYSYANEINIQNCTIADNKIENASAEGSELYLNNLNYVSAYNTIFYQNSEQKNSSVYCTSGADLFIYTCNLYDASNKLTSNNSTFIDILYPSPPLFADSKNLNYRLDAASPYRDLGSLDINQLQIPTQDIAGNPRVVLNRIDIGAYEFNYENCSTTLSDNTTWENTQELSCNVIVPAGKTLTIKAGSIVKFIKPCKIIVLGRILAQGSSSDSISFLPQNDHVGWLGIRFENANDKADSSILEHCFFGHGKYMGINEADSLGGVVSMRNYSKVRMSHCGFLSNFTIYHGGGLALFNSSPVLENNHFLIGVASKGAGIYCTENSNPLIRNNLIKNNKGAYGLGIYCDKNSNAIITNNRIADNPGAYEHYSRYGQSGAGIYCSQSNPVLKNNLINHNFASKGSGIFCTNNANAKIYNTTIADNLGEGVYIDKSNPVLVNTIVWENNRQALSGIYDKQIIIKDSKAKISYCSIENGETGISKTNFSGWYENNVDFDPLFTDSYHQDFHLHALSKCRNIGYPTIADLELPSTDLDGNPRVALTAIDLGAYEDTIQQTLCGSYKIGKGQYYSSLTEAMKDINRRGVSCPCTFYLTDSLYQESPMLLNPVLGSSSTNTLTFCPYTSTPVRISLGDSDNFYWTYAGRLLQNPIIADFYYGIGLIGTDNIIFDGKNCTSITSKSSTFLLFNKGNDGASNNKIKNININGGEKAIESYGRDNNKNTIENNTISNVEIGIQMWVGTASYTDFQRGNQILRNRIGSENTPYSVKKTGIYGEAQTELLVSENKIVNIQNTNTCRAMSFFDIAQTRIVRNEIKDIVCTGTATANGIFIAASADTTQNVRIENNFISHIAGQWIDPIEQTSGLYIGAFSNGMITNLGIYFNSIYLTKDPQYGLSSANKSTAVYLNALDLNKQKVFNLDFRNNIIQNSLGEKDDATITSTAYAIYCENLIPFSGIDKNIYYVSQHDNNFIAFNGTSQSSQTLSQWQNSLNRDWHSLQVRPSFLAENNLHIEDCQGIKGDKIEVNEDFDGDIREEYQIGADETYTLPHSPQKPMGLDSVCNTEPTLFYTRPSLRATSYQWTISPMSAGNFTISDTSALIKWNTRSFGVVSITVDAVNKCGHRSSETLVENLRKCFSLSVNIFAGNERVKNGILVLYNNDSNDDSQCYPLNYVPFTDGYYKYQNLKLGNYWIYAIGEINQYKDYIPTYFGDEFLWQNAIPLPTEMNYDTVNIHLRKRSSWGTGSSSINGNIADMGKSNYRKSIFDNHWFDFSYPNTRPISNPARNVSVILLNKNYAPLAWTLTDENGYYEFSHLPDGEYKIDIQQTGIDIKKLLLQGTANFNYTLTWLAQNEKNYTLQIFPNPVQDILYIKVADYHDALFIEVYDVLGKKWINESQTLAEKKYIALDTSPLSQGMYILKLTDSQKHSTCIKFVK